MVALPIVNSPGTVAHVDYRDRGMTRYRWFINKEGYVRRYQKRETISLHRELLGLTHGDGLEGDHIDGDPLNNRRSNLRVLPLGGNAQNRPSYRNTSSRYRGVTFAKDTGRWQAGCADEYLGQYDTEEEAATVAREARLRMLPYTVESGRRRESSSPERIRVPNLNAQKTRCAQDHEYTPENTYITSRGHRQCKTCKVERTQQWRARNPRKPRRREMT